MGLNLSCIQTAKNGDVVSFGVMPNGFSMAGNAIEWIVLSGDDEKKLLIAKNTLANVFFDEADSGKWADSEIRYFLNFDFLRTAFSKEEQTHIMTVSLNNMDGKDTVENCNGTFIDGKTTKDRIFFLSTSEIENYLIDPTIRIASPLSPSELEASSIGFCDNSKGTIAYWTRTPAMYSDQVSIVCPNGDISGCFASQMYVAMRPALWISFKGNNSIKFESDINQFRILSSTNFRCFSKSSELVYKLNQQSLLKCFNSSEDFEIILEQKEECVDNFSWIEGLDEINTHTVEKAIKYALLDLKDENSFLYRQFFIPYAEMYNTKPVLDNLVNFAVRLVRIISDADSYKKVLTDANFIGYNGVFEDRSKESTLPFFFYLPKDVLEKIFNLHEMTGVQYLNDSFMKKHYPVNNQIKSFGNFVALGYILQPFYIALAANNDLLNKDSSSKRDLWQYSFVNVEK